MTQHQDPTYGLVTSGRNFPLPVQLMDSHGKVGSNGSGSDEQAANGYLLNVMGVNFLSNGSTYDRQRGNTQGTLLASGARTAETPSPNVVNYNGRGAVVFVSITAASGTGGLQVVFQGQNPTTGEYHDLHAAPAALTGIGRFTYALYPGSTGGTSGWGSVLPRNFRVRVGHGDATSYTYSLAYSLIV